MGTFVAGSHELSPSINYLLHNKILSGQISSNQSDHNHTDNQTQAQAHTRTHIRTQTQNNAGNINHCNSHSYTNNKNTNNETKTTVAPNIIKAGRQHINQHLNHFHQISAIPPLPPIKCLSPPGRLGPLNVEDYELNYRDSATDSELVERVYCGGIASNQLRTVLWPYLFGLIKHRGRFKINEENGSSGNNSTGKKFSNHYVYIEHEENLKRWNELEKLYYSYQSQWKSIMPDQELRFSTFRERKSLIERDVIRSDRCHPFYAENSQNLSAFTTLLMTYMMYDFDIGYLQGMSDLAAPILYVFNGDLVKSFWVFVEVMKLFRRNFESSQKTIHFQLNCLFRLVKITDPKFAQYLKENECSNCFFVFRCIVCQFKRELMKNNDEDYTKVLCLWDTIWSVQKRQELRAKSKYVHTFTIANGYSNHHHHKQYKVHKQTQQSATTTMTNGHKTSSSPSNILINCKHESGCNNNNRHATNQNNGYQNGLSNGTSQNKYSDGLSSSYNGISIGSKSFHKQLLHSSPLTKSNGSSPSICCMNENGGGNRNGFRNRNRNGTISKNGHFGSQNSNSNRWTPNGTSPLSYSPVSPMSINGLEHNNHQRPAPVKQEQIVYTKETFYSSFDPNQADVPRFELSETEKFVLSLCLSLIRRERNQILLERLDASEIHQHFINPYLARDMDSFIETAYHIYHFINTDCDMQLLVKGANEIDLSPPEAGGVDVPIGVGTSPKNDTADTYDLLRDYFIISPSSYNTSSKYKYSVSQKSWDQFLNNNSPQTD